MSPSVRERKIFNLASLQDLNKDGMLTEADARRWVGRLAAIRGWEATSEEYRSLEALIVGAFMGIMESNTDGAQQITLDAWAAAVVAFSESGRDALSAWCRSFFDIIDADGDGIIGPQEYRDLMASVYIDGPVADTAFGKLDLNGDGHLSYDEFYELFLEFFMSEDPEAPGGYIWGPF